MGKGPEETFLKRQHANGHGDKKKHSTSLTAKECTWSHNEILGLAAVEGKTLDLLHWIWLNWTRNSFESLSGYKPRRDTERIRGVHMGESCLWTETGSDLQRYRMGYNLGLPYLNRVWRDGHLWVAEAGLPITKLGGSLHSKLSTVHYVWRNS